MRIIDRVHREATTEQMDGFIESVERFGDGCEILLLTQTSQQARFFQRKSLPRNVVVRELREVQTSAPEPSDQRPAFSDVLQKVIRDPSVPLLYDRHQFTKWPHIANRSMSAYYEQLTALAYECYRLYSVTGAGYTFYNMTPHSVRNWVGALVAGALAVRPLIAQRTFIPHYFRILRGFWRSSQPLALGLGGEENEAYLSAVEAHSARVLADYETAMPEFQRLQLGANRGKYLSIRRQVRAHWQRPHYVSNAVRCWTALQKVTKPFSPETQSAYVVLFLHYQPEMSTLPEGHGFTPAMPQVLALREALPSDVKVLVAEHPETFRHQCVPAVRNADFYHRIAAIPGVEFVDIDADTFEVIDRALAIATVTGSVGSQSLIRGTPVVYFGMAAGGDFVGKHIYSDAASLREFLAEAIAGRLTKDVVRASTQRALIAEGEFVFRHRGSMDGAALKYTALKTMLQTKAYEQLVADQAQ